ncbi:MAG: hypothetical protein ACRDL7_08890, partial [Gaiellaceae bacterium]
QAPTQKGEYRLLMAVLQDAIDAFQKCATPDDHRSKEAEHWLMGKTAQNEVGLSSEYVCTMLDLNPDYLRRGLRRWRKAQLERARVKSPVGTRATR